MNQQALLGYEKAFGPEHTLMLDTVNHLGILYSEQGKLAKAEEMYLWALRGKEEAWGPKHMRVLVGLEELWGLGAPSTRRPLEQWATLPLFTRAKVG